MRLASFMLATAIGLLSTRAVALPFSLTVTGNVPTNGSIKLGDPLSLIYSFDPNLMADANFIPSPATEVYDGPAKYDLVLPNFAISGEGLDVAYVSYQATYYDSTQKFDQIGFAGPEFEVAQSSMPFAFPAGSPSYEEEFNFGLTDFSATALSSFVFPQSINPAAYAQNDIDIDFNSSAGGIIVSANNLTIIESSISSAPEPNAWALMLAGIGLSGFVLRQKRSAKALSRLAVGPRAC